MAAISTLPPLNCLVPSSPLSASADLARPSVTSSRAQGSFRDSVGRRKKNRHNNDKHADNDQAVRDAKELAKYSELNVCWRSQLQILLNGNHNKELELFRDNNEPATISTPVTHVTRQDEWRDAELMFMRVQKHIRVAFGKSFKSISSFVTAFESVIVAFLTEGDNASLAKMGDNLHNYLSDKLYRLQKDDQAVRSHLAIPLRNSSYLRLFAHGLCQFYGISSKSQLLSGGKVLVLASAKPLSSPSVSFCSFYQHTRLHETTSDVKDCGCSPLASENYEILESSTFPEFVCNDEDYELVAEVPDQGDELLDVSFELLPDVSEA